MSLHPKDTTPYDFAETAGLMAALDLVITVDTATAHLAGALGKPCWILLPWLRTDWRWMQDRDDSPWHPSARLFRQAPGDDWTAVVDRVLCALKLE
jgi:ADP-heptose:LPS heptosyltransferase